MTGQAGIIDFLEIPLGAYRRVYVEARKGPRTDRRIRVHCFIESDMGGEIRVRAHFIFDDTAAVIIAPRELWRQAGYADPWWQGAVSEDGLLSRIMRLVIGEGR